MNRLPPLPDPVRSQGQATDIPQHFLASAHRTVSGIFSTIWLLRDLVDKSVEEGGEGEDGGFKEHIEDLMRAALVLASAGLDATLKQLVRQALPAALQSQAGRSEFEKFLDRHLAAPDRGIDRDCRAAG